MSDEYRFKPTSKALHALLLFMAVLCLENRARSQSTPNASTVSTEMGPFVDSLLRQMTVEEKVEQMEQAAGQSGYTPPDKANELAREGIGSFLFFTDAVRINELQHIAVTESRLHIPLLFGYDVIHGFRTIAPIPLAMASSWDPDLVIRTQTMAAREARAAGITWAFAPMVDIARDARWGRIMESAGEDPFLGEQMAAAQVRGFQGPFVGASDHVLATVKHFAGYGAVSGGRDYDSADISDELLHNVYLRPYEAGVKAGAESVMAAYMNLNGVPATGNTWLLQDILRKEWHFDGFVVSDWESVANLTTHGFATDGEDAALRAAQAGVNMEMTSADYRKYLPEAVRQGLLSETALDALVRPILEAKFRLGLFSHPYVDLDNFKKETLSSDQRVAVREAAEQTAVLLKNEGQVLPLRGDLKSIAVLGPLADSRLDTLGSWAIHGDRGDTITIAAGVREAFPLATVKVATGVEIERGSPTIFDGQVVPEKPQLTTEAQRMDAFKRAVALASEAEVTIMVLGEAQTMSGESASRGSLSLPGEQERLLEAVAGLGKPVVLVLMTGRPLDISWAAGRVPAILNVWYPGTEGGHAVANLLLGKVNPSGHLPVTWPANAGQEPIFYNQFLPHDPKNVAHRYWDMTSAPLFPFGWGLSYSIITTSDLQVRTPILRPTDTLRVSVTLHNTSSARGAQVVQLYVHQRAGSTARPARELKAFQKVWLDGGAVREVELSLPVEQLSYWSSASRQTVLEPGQFDLWVGTDANATMHQSFEVVAGSKDLK